MKKVIFNTNEWKKLTPNKKGAFSENIATNWLLLQGYDVFRNVSYTGQCDMIAWRNGDAIFIDVSCIGIDSGGRTCDSKKQWAIIGEKNKVKILYVMPNGECMWREDFLLKEERECIICNDKFSIRVTLPQKKCHKHRTRAT